MQNATRVCPACYKNLAQSQCSRCYEPFRSVENKARNYRKNTDFSNWLRPYNPDYSKKWNHLCPSCYEECVSSCKKVQWLLANWMGRTKAEFIHGHRTMKSLGRVEYKGISCENPAEVEEYLKLYSAQLGGNGFIKFFWQKNEKRHAEKVLAGYSKNDNPYYRTEYWTERWFTGYATAVIVDDFNNKRQDDHRPAASEMRDMQNIRSVVLDGLNICYWLNPNQKSPDRD